MQKYLIIDTETANGLDCPIFYDFGFAVIDDLGTVYEQGSYVVREVFTDKEFMTSAYYAEKCPQYWADLKAGTRKMARLSTIAEIVRKVMREYGIDTVIAHNARFDALSTRTTQRYMTSSRYRYFFPRDTHFCDTLKMARAVLGKDENYREFCVSNGYLTKRNCLRFTAEILHRYLSGDNEFVEAHTALADVLIEKDIFAYCKAQNPNCDGLLW